MTARSAVTAASGNRGASGVDVHVDATGAVVASLTVMGVRGSVTAYDVSEPVCVAGARRLYGLEAAWSRFRPDSDVSRLNRAAGDWVEVGADTVLLLEWMGAACELTGGAFAPGLLPATLELGDDTSRTANGDSAGTFAVPPLPERSCASRLLDGLSVDRAAGRARLPAGVALDPGGIGKGLAADVVATELTAAGASAVCVNVGGDLRCVGRPGSPADSFGAAARAGNWRVVVCGGEHHDVPLWELSVSDGAVATSSVLARRWRTPSGEAVHHLLDPSSGRPLGAGPDDLELVSVAAGHAAWAEAFTKAVLVLGWDGAAPLLDRYQIAAAGRYGNGSTCRNEAWERLCVPTGPQHAGPSGSSVLARTWLPSG